MAGFSDFVFNLELLELPLVGLLSYGLTTKLNQRWTYFLFLLLGAYFSKCCQKRKECIGYVRIISQSYWIMGVFMGSHVF